MIDILIEGMTENAGGKETFIINSFKKMDKQRFSFSFISYEPEIAYEEYLRGQGAKIIHIPPRSQGLFKYRRAITRLFSKNNYDVVWAHKTTLSSCEVLEIAKSYGVPVRIIHSHSSSNMGGKLTYILHTINKRKIRKWANLFFACSETAREWFFGKMPCELIKNGIEIERFRYNTEIRNRVRAENKWSGCFVIGHVGRFGVEKNHKKLISVFNEIAKTNKNVRLVLCGDGEERESIQNLVNMLSLDNQVLFLGMINNVNEIMQAMDVFVMPSIFEGLPFVLVEAQCAGLPCIVSSGVSKEADLVPGNCFLELEADDAIWAQAIMASSSEGDRTLGADLVREKGYDLDQTVSYIERRMTAELSS